MEGDVNSPTTVASAASWAAILNLKSLELNSVLIDLLSSNRHKIHSILAGDHAALTQGGPQALGDLSAAEALVQCCCVAKAAGHRVIIDQLRWLFLTLLVGDLKNSFYGTGVSLNEARVKEIQRVLTERQNHMESHAVERSSSIIVTMDLKDLTHILKMGDNLEWMCRQLGTGCIFFLCQTLSENL